MRGPGRRLSEEDLTGEIGDVRERTLEGLKWLTYARGGLQFVGILSAVVIARLVPPDEFGRAAVALAIFQVGSVVGYEGFGASIVQRPSVDRRYLEAASFFALAGGLALAVLTAAALYPLFAALIDIRTATLTLILCASFVVSAAATVPKSILRRRLDFRQLALNEVAVLAVSVGVTVGLAFAGLDAEAIVLGSLLATTTGTALAFAVAPGALPRPHLEPLRELGRFATSVQAASVLYTAGRYGAVTVVGATLGSASAGFFQRAYSLGAEYQNKISSIMLTVAFPVYSRMRDLSEAIVMRRRIVRVHTTVLFPFLLLIATQAPVLVPFAYGQQWTPAVTPTTIIAVAGLAAAVLSGTGPIVMAAGRPDAILRYNAVATVGLLAALAVGGSFGLIQTCFVFLGAMVINLVAAQYYLLGKAVGIPFRDLIDDVGPAAVAGLALVLVAAPASAALDSAGVPAVVNLLLASGTGVLVYLVVLRLGFPDSWRDFYLLVDRVTKVSRITARLRPRQAKSV